MNLKDLELGDTITCKCKECCGTGIYKGFAQKEDLAILCSHCSGRGFTVLELEIGQKLVQDEANGIVYLVENGVIISIIEVFDKIKERKDVNYVIYTNRATSLSPDYLFENGESEVNVIRYEEFLKGVLPLPMMKYTCPRWISQSFGKSKFDNDCGIGTFTSCKKFGKSECWDKF